MTSNGEEATIIGSAAALSPEDHIFSQYREHGALLYRGFSFLDMANQVISPPFLLIMFCASLASCWRVPAILQKPWRFFCSRPDIAHCLRSSSILSSSLSSLHSLLHPAEQRVDEGARMPIV